MEIWGIKLSKVLVADIQVLGSAFFFGIGFIGQRAVSVDGLGPMTCNAFRFALSTVLLIACMPWMPNLSENIEPEPEEDDDNEKSNSTQYDKSVKTDSTSYVLNKLLGINSESMSAAKKTVLFWGIFLGFVNFFASGFQQWGITMISANKVAFIAGFDLFLTPVLGLIIPTFKRNGKPAPSTWLAVWISIYGIYLLSDADIAELKLGLGEILTLISTVFWTMHITYTDLSTSYVDTMHMMCVQLTVVTLLSAIAAIMLEPQGWFWHHVLVFVPWMLFLAVSEGLGFTLMAMGQNYSPPTHAAIILSLEGVFASIASFIVLGETLSFRESVGCVLMLLATLVAKVGCNCIDKPVGHAQTKSHKGDLEAANNNGSPLSKSNHMNSQNMHWALRILLIPYFSLREFLLQHSHSLFSINKDMHHHYKDSNGEHVSLLSSVSADHD